MNRLFREALNDATGESGYIFAIFVDIRGFSNFSKICEAPNIATFIKSFFIKLIDHYFDYATFYKSTGDGLLLVVPYDEANLEEMAKKVMDSCIKVHSEFCDICRDDKMVNFEVPKNIGIGIARDTACRLVSEAKGVTIDYSGRLLNLAARLMDLARPSGIVIDGAFGVELLSVEQQAMFKDQNVYLRGIYESTPLQIYYTNEFTNISMYNRQPIAEESWREKIIPLTLKECIKLDGGLLYELSSKPTSEDEIKVMVEYPSKIKGKIKGKVGVYSKFHDFKHFQYRVTAGKPGVWLDTPKLGEYLKLKGIKTSSTISVNISYIER